MSKLVISSPALENAVKEKFSTHTPERRFGRSSLNELRPARYGDEYNGFFKVSINNEQIIVYDGEQLDSEYAGYIDLPQFDGVKKTFLPYPSTDIDRYVYLHACYNSEKGYFATITFARSYVSDSFWYTTLAAVSNSTPVRQIFNSNDMINLSKDFYL